MKRLIASAGLIAVSAAAVHGAYAPGLSSTQTSKPWSVSASLRGFYDDNYNTVASGEEESFGIEALPSVSLNLTTDQTYIGLSARYSMRWYEDRPDEEFDHTFQFDGILDHAFNERYQVDLSDSFIIAQEPEVLDSGSLVRSEGDNIRNRAAINFSAQLTQLLTGQIGYANTFWDYEQEASDVTTPGAVSRSGLLDRMEHVASANLRWQALRNTVALIGYQFRFVDYTDNEVLDPVAVGGSGMITSENRNNYGHYVFVGADHDFRPDLSGSLRVGGRFTDYYDSVSGTDNQISPYVDGSLTYNYARGSEVYAGVRHDMIQTDMAFLAGSTATDITTDQAATSLYAGVTHQFSPKLIGSANGTYQYAEFNNGGADGDAENFLSLGLSLRYLINQYLSTEAGYSFYNLDSDIGGREYTRNRIFIGVTATY
jgi:hypothetical protein